jgi:uncharacterized phage-associated protein
MAKTTALAVANYLIAKGREEGIPIRHLKLQKLLYFCYAWYAGNTGEELFPEDIEAWQYGPVVRDIYARFKDSGSQPITRPGATLDWDTFEQIIPKAPDDVAADLQSVWDAYKRKSDAWLVDASHRPGEPWAIVAREQGLAGKPPIPFDLIRSKYARRVEAIDA